MLAVALTHHEGALRASLMAEYGIRLDVARETFRARELADYTVWLPAGCPLWQDFGGAVALSDTVQAIQLLDYSVRVLDYHQTGGKGQKPKKPESPPFAHEKRAHDSVMDRKAERYFRRSKGRLEPH